MGQTFICAPELSVVQQINAKIPKNSSLNHASIKFGTDIHKGPLFHKSDVSYAKIQDDCLFSKMAVIHWPVSLPHFREYGCY